MADATPIACSHGVGAALAFNGMAIACLVFARRFTALRKWGWVPASVATAVSTVAIGSWPGDGISVRLVVATAILFALEAGLDFDNGGTVAPALARLYAGTRMTVVNAAVGDDPTPFRDVADTLDEIGQAWRTARAA